MRQIAIALLLLVATEAWSCKCGGTSSIEETIAHYPVLVEAEVVALEKVNFPHHAPEVDRATLKVINVLKGAVKGETITVKQTTCYSTLHLELMNVGHKYILPLTEPMDEHYGLAGCAHSGLELIAGMLYTFERANGTQRRLQFYKNYSEFLSELKN